jgi:hypothetical protein
MRSYIFIAAFALAACGQTEAPHASADIGAPPPAPAIAEAPAAFSAQTLVGRWGDSGDCSKDVVFNADGTFHSYTGGDGQYSVDGDLITMSGDGGVFQLRARVLDAGALELTNPSGAVFTSQRC